MEDNQIVKHIFEFKDSKEINQWISVNDVVMGGKSSGNALYQDSCLLFTGNLSLENNGGFASIRTKPEKLDFSDFYGLKIRVKGDGRTYQFRIRTDDRFDGIAYRKEFETKKDSWVEIELPFDSFSPTFRGNVLDNVPVLNPAKIKQLGFLIADKNESEFSLLVDFIIVFK